MEVTSGERQAITPRKKAPSPPQKNQGGKESETGKVGVRERGQQGSTQRIQRRKGKRRGWGKRKRGGSEKAAEKRETGRRGEERGWEGRRRERENERERKEGVKGKKGKEKRGESEREKKEKNRRCRSPWGH